MLFRLFSICSRDKRLERIKKSIGGEHINIWEYMCKGISQWTIKKRYLRKLGENNGIYGYSY